MSALACGKTPQAIFFSINNNKKTLKKHDKFLSTIPFNLEKKHVKNLYFCAFPPSLFTGRFVTCGL